MRALVSLCADREANDLERAAVSRHVRACPACLEFMQLVADVREAQLDLAEAVPMPERSGSELAALIRSKDRGGRRRRTIRAVLAGSAAAVVVLVLLGSWGMVGDGWVRTRSIAPGAGTGSIALVSPRVTARRVLDAGYGPDAKRTNAVLRVTEPDPIGVADGRATGSQASISWYDEVHYRPSSY
jgi:hypothetical protein